MATSAEIRNKAAKKLGLFGTGQTLQSNISADIDNAYTEVYGELVALGVATWAQDSVPDAFVTPVVSLVARSRVNEYSIPDNKYQRIMADALQAEGRIRQLQAKPGKAVTQMVEF